MIVTAPRSALNRSWNDRASGPAVPTSTTVQPDSNVLFSDDFDGAELNLGKWKAPNRPDHIRQEDGRLMLSTRPGEGVDYTNVEPVGLQRPFTEAHFNVVIPTYASGGQGGGAFVLNPRGDQPQLLALGPAAVVVVYWSRRSLATRLNAHWTSTAPSPNPTSARSQTCAPATRSQSASPTRTAGWCTA